MKMKTIKELLSINPDTLKNEQYLELKNHAKSILTRIIGLLDSDRLDDIESFMQESPAGDGYGLDNYYINFNFSDSEYGDDIECLLNKLKSLTPPTKN